MRTGWQKKCILFLTGQTVSLFGSMLVQYAVYWYITLTTMSGSLLTLYFIAACLPQVVISLFAGVWADRLNRKMLIIVSDAAIAISTFILAVLFTFGIDSMWLLLVLSAVRSFGAGIQTPAVGALLPDIVPEDNLMRVNGIYASIQGAMMFVAPIAAGALYQYMSMTHIFGIDVITAIIGITILALIKIDKAEQKIVEKVHVLREMTSGIRYVVQTKWLRQFMIFYSLFALALGPMMTLAPLMVARSFGSEEWRLVVHEIGFATGMTAGGLVVGAVAKKIHNTVYMVIAACVAFGVTTFVIGFSSNFWFYVAILIPMGASWPFINSGSMTVLQTKSKPEYLGRVLSLVSIVINASVPLSVAVFGPMSDHVRIEILLIVTGAMMTAIAVLMLRFRDMVKAGKAPAEGEATAEQDSGQLALD